MAVNKNSRGKYEARIFWQGKQVAMGTFPRKDTADNWYDQQVLALKSNAWVNPRKGKTPLGDVITAFVEARKGTIAEHTWDTEEANLRLHIPAESKRKPVASFDTDAIDTILAAMLTTHARPTVLRVRDSIVALLGWAEGKKYMHGNAALKAKVPYGNGQDEPAQRPFTQQELESLIARAETVNPRYALFVEFLALTGIRWGEMRALRVRDIEQMPMLAVHIRRSQSDGYAEKDTKSRRSRRVPLWDRSAEIAAQFSAGRSPRDFLFVTASGTRPHGRNFSRDLSWKEIAAGHRVHDLRHTAATNWLAAGIDIATVSQWLGHSSARFTLDTYISAVGALSNEAAIARMRAAQAGSWRSETA